MTPLIWSLIILIGLLVGTMIGAVGIGGVLLAPLLVLLLGMDLSLAMATSMWSFLFTGAMGVISYARQGSIDWTLSGWLMVGIIPASLLGARTNVGLSAGILALILAAVLLYSALSALMRPPNVRESGTSFKRPWRLVVGAFVGFGSALTGTGGAVLLMPLFLLMGVPALRAVGVVQGIQLPIAVSASLGFLLFGHVDFFLGSVLGVVQAIGVGLGAHVAHRIPAGNLRQLAAAALIVAAGILIRQVLFGG